MVILPDYIEDALDRNLVLGTARHELSEAIHRYGAFQFQQGQKVGEDKGDGYTNTLPESGDER